MSKASYLGPNSLILFGHRVNVCFGSESVVVVYCRISDLKGINRPAPDAANQSFAGSAGAGIFWIVVRRGLTKTAVNSHESAISN